MGEPSPEALPRCPPLFVDTVGEIERVFLVALEHISQLACYVLVKDGEVHLIVTFEAARIEVCRAYSAVSAIDHDDFRMMEAGLVDPYLASLLLQLVTVIEDTVRCKGYIAWLCYHYLHCDASLHSICQRPSYLRYKSEIGVYEAYRVLGVAYGVVVELAYSLGRTMWLTVYCGTEHTVSCVCPILPQPIVFIAWCLPVEIALCPDILSCHFLPCPEEYLLQRVHLWTLKAAMHVSPCPYGRCPGYIIVGYVHASGVCYLSVYDNDFPMVSAEDMVYPWEAYRVKLVYVYAPFA